MLLNTNDPQIKDLKDFTGARRIGLPAVKVSIQAVVLQMAAKEIYGDPFRLDTMTVSMRHTDAMAALLSGQSHSACYRSEEHTSELQSLMRITYAVFCLKKKNI